MGTVQANMTDYWNVADFNKYLGKIGLSGDLGQVTRILSAMERAGLILSAGWQGQLPIMGQQYLSQGFTSPQSEGNLWLSEVLGAELIIPSYNLVTVLLAGIDAEGNPGEQWGTGLILDHTHIVTNKHVVMSLTRTRPDRRAPVQHSGGSRAGQPRLPDSRAQDARRRGHRGAPTGR